MITKPKTRTVIAVISAMILSGAHKLTAETTIYSYDAKGRLRSSCQYNSGRVVKYNLDRADNRTRYLSQDVIVRLNTNQRLYSQDQRFFLAMQGDGNLVLYGPTGALWASHTVGSGASFTAFQSDGNLVLYGPSGAIWASNTAGNSCSNLAIQNDGNLVIYAANGAAIWSTGTYGH